MSIRSSLAYVYLAYTVLIPAVGSAQRSDVPTITVMTFQSKNRGLGSRVADMLRDKLSNDFSSDELHTVPTSDVSTNLENAGFSIDESLAPNDERQLANLLRADIYVSGSISQTANGDYHFEPRLVMPTDLTLVQPLPAINKKKLDDLMDPVSRSIKEAMRQLDGNQKCIAGVNSKSFAAAVTGARAAIAVYPRASIARLCMAKAFFAQYINATSHTDSVAYADSVLAISAVILQEDSLSIPVLQYNVAVYKFTGDTAMERRALLSLVHADPNNGQLIQQVINSLAGEGRVQDAIPLVKDLINKSPGDAHILELAFRVYNRAEDWKAVIAVGQELIKANPAAGGIIYFRRMATAYEQLNQHQQAIDILNQATAKFPGDAELWSDYANALMLGGEPQRAAEASRRVISLNSQVHMQRAYYQLISFYDTTNSLDSVYVIAQRAAQTPGVNKRIPANIVLTRGNKILQTVRDAPGATVAPATVRANLQNALKFLRLSDQIQPSVEAQFLIAAATFQIMQSATEEADKTKSCQLAQLAQQSYQDAGSVLQSVSISDNPKNSYKQQAQEVLGYLPKFRPTIESQVKKFCK